MNLPLVNVYCMFSLHAVMVSSYLAVRYSGQLSPSPDGKIIWNAHLGGFLLTAWDAHNKCHCFDVDTSEHMAMISSDISEKDRIMTAMVPAEDCVWVGMATGHILVFSDEELLTWFHPYTEYVRFLTVLPCPGPCGLEECMVASGGKGFQSMITDIESMHSVNGKGGCIILWEAFTSKTYRQMKLIEESVPEMFDSHDTVSQIITRGEFVDGTHILKILKPKDDSSAQTSSTGLEIYTPGFTEHHNLDVDTCSNLDVAIPGFSTIASFQGDLPTGVADTITLHNDEPTHTNFSGMLLCSST